MTDIEARTLQALVGCDRHVFHGYSWTEEEGDAERNNRDMCIRCGKLWWVYREEMYSSQHYSHRFCECYDKSEPYWKDEGLRCKNYKYWWENDD